ncbi:hypothetical protein CcCBS67573_g05630 [Chytriomyces confervae]|uniref:Endoplasmic reticulum junction formation protein lunapark n=1 Tax=Chytriomyces confervae TaxID=246404 RepID=A0A507FAC7_9FUNG|nr:hypothetical protein CcCBS67573_g05630 [Chytriomyces confervae]
MLRWLTGGKEDFAQVLQDIDNEIQRIEEDMASFEAASHAVRSALLKYLGAVYAAFLAAYFTVMSPAEDTLLVWIAKAAVLALFPVGIYYSRKLVDIWYKAKLRSSSRRLDTLRATQKIKIEELKKKTGYYTTKTLIDKFDTPPKPIPKLNSPGKGLTPARTPIKPNVNMPSNSPHLLNANAAMQTPNMNGVGGLKVNLTPSNRDARATPSSTWFDRVMDAVVGGEEGPQNKYALICQSCFVHNGLVPPEQYNDIKFKCMACGHLNSSIPFRNASRSNSIDSSFNHGASPSIRSHSPFDENPSHLMNHPNERSDVVEAPVSMVEAESQKADFERPMSNGEDAVIDGGVGLVAPADSGANEIRDEASVTAVSEETHEDDASEVRPFEVQGNGGEETTEKENQSKQPSKKSSDRKLRKRTGDNIKK